MALVSYHTSPIDFQKKPPPFPKPALNFHTPLRSRRPVPLSGKPPYPTPSLLTRDFRSWHGSTTQDMLWPAKDGRIIHPSSTFEYFINEKKIATWDYDTVGIYYLFHRYIYILLTQSSRSIHPSIKSVHTHTLPSFFLSPSSYDTWYHTWLNTPGLHHQRRWRRRK